MAATRTIRTLIARTPCKVIDGNNITEAVRIQTSDGLKLWVDIDHLDVDGYKVRRVGDDQDDARKNHIQGLVGRARLDLLGEA